MGKQATREQSAYLLRRAMSACNVGVSWLATRLDVHKTHVSNWCDPVHDRGLSLSRLLQIRLVCPRLFDEVVRQMAELEALDGEPWSPQETHVRNAVSALGRVAEGATAADRAAEMPRKLRAQIDRDWAALEGVARAGRRDLGRHDR
jgi:hypothetical protein